MLALVHAGMADGAGLRQQRLTPVPPNGGRRAAGAVGPCGIAHAIENRRADHNFGAPCGIATMMPRTWATVVKLAKAVRFVNRQGRERYWSRASTVSPVKALQDIRRQPLPDSEHQRITQQWAALGSAGSTGRPGGRAGDGSQRGQSEQTRFTALQEQGRAAPSGGHRKGWTAEVKVRARVARRRRQGGCHRVVGGARIHAGLNPARGFFAGAKTGMPVPGARCCAWS